MKRFALLATTFVTVFATGALGSLPARAVPASGARVQPLLAKKAILTGLNQPVAFAFLPDGRLVYGEKATGRIWFSNLSTKKKTLFHTILNIQATDERGLVGLTVDPNWPTSPYIYAYATRNLSTGLVNQILRIKSVNDAGKTTTVIFTENVTPAINHNGGKMAFGPDGDLYVVIGDAAIRPNAQDLTKDAGKVLRMTSTGGIPPDNPFPGSRVFSYGLRNSLGLAFDPQTGKLWETENGPECNDEINLEQAGENHAWGPTETCSTPPAAPGNTNQDGPLPRILPLAYWATTIAPTGAVFCSSCNLGTSEGDLYFGAFNTGDIRDVRLTTNRTAILNLHIAYHNSSGIYSMERSPSGTIYFSSADNAIYQLSL